MISMFSHTCGHNGVDDFVVIRNGILIDRTADNTLWRTEKSLESHLEDYSRLFAVV